MSILSLPKYSISQMHLIFALQIFVFCLQLLIRVQFMSVDIYFTFPKCIILPYDL